MYLTNTTKADMKQNNTWIIAVHYGNDHDASMKKILGKLNRHVQFNYICIRTNLAPGVFLADPNEAYEFSGYQEGLFRVLQALDNAQATGESPESVKIVFLNDTAATGHNRLLTMHLIKLLLEVDAAALKGAAITGLHMPTSAAIAELSKGPYSSTWAFALCGPLDTLHKVRFYKAEETRNHFFEQKYATLSENYKKEIDRWLEPTHLLKGWYKSTPGRPLTPEVKKRKTLAIYLEHSLPAKVYELAIASFDIRFFLTSPSKRLVTALIFLDKIYVNYLKLKFRLLSRS